MTNLPLADLKALNLAATVRDALAEGASFTVSEASELWTDLYFLARKATDRAVVRECAKVMTALDAIDLPVR